MVVDETIDDGERHGLVAEHDRTLRCGQEFPPEEGWMERRARHLILRFGPALPDRSPILAPRVWPMMSS